MVDADHELDGLVRVRGTLVVTDFPDGRVGAGVVVDAPFSVQPRFKAQFLGGLVVSQVTSGREDGMVLVDAATLGVTGQVNVNGDVNVMGDVRLLGGDVAEQFRVDGPDLEPGTVVVAGSGEAVHACESPYDRRVTGVVCGAGSYRPGLVLNAAPDVAGRPVALAGRVMCKVVADDEPISIGDPLTTSGTSGHAMRATDRDRSFGAVIGKALGELASGTGLVPVLVALR